MSPILKDPLLLLLCLQAAVLLFAPPLHQNASEELCILSVSLLPLLHSNSRTHCSQDLIPTLH